jgi:hypothetical protein
MRWAINKCLDDEGRIPLIDFSNLVVNFSGEQVLVRNGGITGRTRARFFASFDNVQELDQNRFVLFGYNVD